MRARIHLTASKHCKWVKLQYMFLQEFLNLSDMTFPLHFSLTNLVIVFWILIYSMQPVLFSPPSHPRRLMQDNVLYFLCAVHSENTGIYGQFKNTYMLFCMLSVYAVTYHCMNTWIIQEFRSLTLTKLGLLHLKQSEGCSTCPYQSSFWIM